MFQNSNQNFQKKILNERIARLCGGIAIIQVNSFECFWIPKNKDTMFYNAIIMITVVKILV